MPHASYNVLGNFTKMPCECQSTSKATQANSHFSKPTAQVSHSFLNSPTKVVLFVIVWQSEMT
jgi:hypothetical protein